MLKRHVKLAIQIFVPVVILGYLFLTLDIGALGKHLARTSAPLFLAAFALLCIRNFVGAYRSRVLLRIRGLRFTVAALTRYYFIGFFFNLFLPEIVGRDIARGWYLYRSSEGKTASVSAIVAERLIGTAALIVMSIASIGYAAFAGLAVFENDVITAVFVVFVLSCAGLGLVFNARTERILERLIPAGKVSPLITAVDFLRDVVSYRRALPTLLYAFAVSLLFQLVGVAAAYLLARSLGDDTAFVYYLILLPVIWVLGMLPVSVNGLGVREGSFVLLFGSVGMPKELAMAVSILWFAQNLGLGLIGGILFAVEKKPRDETGD